MKRVYLSLVLLLFVKPLFAVEYKVGGVYGCAISPNFIAGLGFEQPAIDTTATSRVGVIIRDTQGQRLSFQHPSWRESGHVGSTVRDAQGHMYIIPVPTIGLDTNPLNKRNTVYRIDSNTGLLSTFIELPLNAEQSQLNPFGTLGIAYDCETDSLYVSSVAGSTSASVKGVIYQIDIGTAKVVDQLPNIDALGLGIFNTPTEKRLYYGDARSSSLFSIILDQSGNFNRVAKTEYVDSLLAIKNGDSTQVRKINFNSTPTGQHYMALSDTEFSYRLTAETGRRYKIYNFQFSNEKNEWLFLSVLPQQ